MGYVMVVVAGASMALSVLGNRRRPLPPPAALLMGLGVPLLSRITYGGPMDLGAFVVVMLVGLAAGAVLHRLSPAWGPFWVGRVGPTTVLMAVWAVAFLWMQVAEIEAVLGAFQAGVVAFGIAGGAWAGYVVADRLRPHVQWDRLLAEYGDVLEADPALIFTATHIVPTGGMQAWPAPDPSLAAQDLGGGLPLRVVEYRGAWAFVQAENGWTGWVDARRLHPISS